MDEKRRAPIEWSFGNRFFWFLVAVVLLILIVPEKPGKTPEKPTDIPLNQVLSETKTNETQEIMDLLEQLRSENIVLTKNLYPNSLTFKWTGGPFEGSATTLANKIARRLYSHSGRSVMVILEIENRKYSALYEP